MSLPPTQAPPGYRKIVDTFRNTIMVPLSTSLSDSGAALLPFTTPTSSHSTYRRPSPLVGSSPPDLPDDSPFPPGQSFHMRDESGEPMELVMNVPYERDTEFPFPRHTPPSPYEATTSLEYGTNTLNIASIPLAPSPPTHLDSALGEPWTDLLASFTPAGQGNLRSQAPSDTTPPQAILPFINHTPPPRGRPPANAKAAPGFRSPNVLYTPADTLNTSLRRSPAMGPPSLPVSPGTLPVRQPSWRSPFTPGNPLQSTLATPNTGAGPSPAYRFPMPTPLHAMAGLGLHTPGNANVKQEPDLFTPGYTMGPHVPNALDLQLGEQQYLNLPSSSPEAPRNAPMLTPPSNRPILSQLFPEEYATPPPKTMSKIAQEALADHTLHPDFSRRYTLLDEIGSGGFGFVCSAVQTGVDNKPGVEVAVKFMIRENLPRRGDCFTGDVPTEVWVLRQCDHWAIIKFLDYYEDHKFFYIVQELHGKSWCREIVESPTQLESPGMLSPWSARMPERRASEATPVIQRPFLGRRASYDLFEAVEVVRFTDNQAKWIFKQIVEAVYYMHCRGFYHRDLKDENIVIDHNFDVKIIDFGSAIYEDPTRPPRLHHTFRGTHSYASPEIHNGTGYYSGPCDIWSLGIILTILLTGQPPFPNKEAAIAGKIGLKSVVSPYAMEVIKGCLQVDMRKRWNILQVRKHNLIHDVGPELVELSMTPRRRAQAKAPKKGKKSAEWF